MREISFRNLDRWDTQDYNNREVMKMSKGNPQAKVRLAPAEFEQLKALAATKGTTVSDLLRREVKRLLEENKK